MKDLIIDNSNSNKKHEKIRSELFLEIKPFTQSIFNQLSLYPNYDLRLINQSINQLINIILKQNNLSSFNQTLTHYTLYPLQHLLQLEISNELTLQLIRPLIQQLIQSNPSISSANLEQLQLILQSTLKLAIESSNQSPSPIQTIQIIIQIDPLPSVFIPTIFTSLTDLLSSSTNQTSHSPLILDTVSFALKRIRDVPGNGLQLITILLPRTASVITRSLLSLLKDSSNVPTRILIAKLIEILNYIILESLHQDLPDLSEFNITDSGQLSPSNTEPSQDLSKKDDDNEKLSLIVVRDQIWLKKTMEKIKEIIILLVPQIQSNSSITILRPWSNLLISLIKNLTKFCNEEFVELIFYNIILIQFNRLYSYDDGIFQLNEIIKTQLIPFTKSITRLIKENIKKFYKLIIIYKLKDEKEQIQKTCKIILSCFDIVLNYPQIIKHLKREIEYEEINLLNLLKSIELKISPISNKITIKDFDEMSQSLIERSIEKLGELFVQNGNEFKVLEFLYNQSKTYFSIQYILIHLIKGINNKHTLNHQILRKRKLENYFKRDIIPKLLFELDSQKLNEQEELEGGLIKKENIDDDNDNEQKLKILDEDHKSLMISYQKGLTTLPELEKLKPTTISLPLSTLKLRQKLIFELLSSIACFLSQDSLTSILPSSLYNIIRYPSSSDLLSTLAYESGYGSIQNMIRDHSDYILDSAARSLLPQRIKPDIQAPQVIVDVVEIVGVKELIGPVGELVVEEIGEALEDFQDYHEFVEGVVKAYERMIELMACEFQGQSQIEMEMNEEIRKQDETIADEDKFSILDKLERSRRCLLSLIGNREDPIKEKSMFMDWYQARIKLENQDLFQNSSLDAINSKNTFEPDPTESKLEEKEAEVEEKEESLSIYERVTISIISQTLPLLTHPSTILRKSIINLSNIAIQSGILTKPSKIVPIFKRFWNIILNEGTILAESLMNSKFHDFFKPEIFNGKLIGIQSGMSIKERLVWNYMIKNGGVGVDGTKSESLNDSIELFERAKKGEVKGLEFLRLDLKTSLLYENKNVKQLTFLKR
ncbi:hypothetical protein CROQUDRAFT_88060 [Cronartium quercuum f. sp. fusiforme G11]|uniref:Uncharacterized protein n=1 Tax=Cronartium quercuum f. sp. fusiforme G11 TaxID=708437 RepID=A0A9P6NVG5_9BASI|nr:hypothetical protein CROQUDRAFT_88060 [Cronartium quercuum f. sp. fusiforme G11]